MDIGLFTAMIMDTNSLSRMPCNKNIIKDIAGTSVHDNFSIVCSFLIDKEKARQKIVGECIAFSYCRDYLVF